MTVTFILPFVSALLLALSFSPVGLWPLAWIALVPLLFSASVARTARRAFLSGYLFGIVFFLSTVYWVVHSMYYFGGVPFVIGAGVTLLLSAYLALYPAFFAAFLRVVLARVGVVSGIFLVIFIPALWIALEYLRGTLFTGFPWVLAGYSQSTVLPIIQAADLVGVWGIGFLVLLVNAAIFFVLRGLFGKAEAAAGRGALVPLLVALVLLTSTLAYGFIKIKTVDVEAASWKRLRVAAVQGSIDQSLKWDKEMRLKTVESYARLTAEAAFRYDGTELVVWPETAVPTFIAYDTRIGSIVKDAAEKGNLYVLTGAPHYEQDEEGTDYFNSAFLVSPKDSAGVIERYDKVKLVPFGEYVPLSRLLFFVEKIAVGIGDFSSGPGHTPLGGGSLGGGIGVLICFESIFPDIAARSIRNGASLLVNITNDAWFGRTSAPYQHFEMSVLRAVENRSYLIRSANTGISAVIDPVGRVKGRTELFKEAVVAEEIGLKGGDHTFFSNSTWLVPMLSLIFSAAVIFYVRYRR